MIFDCDGVLVDSEPFSTQALAESLTAFGVPMTTERSVELFMGRSWISGEQTMRDELGFDPPPQLREHHARLLAERFESAGEAVPGVRDVLVALRSPSCVASSGDHARIRFVLRVCDLLGFFPDERIFSADDVEHGKPAPDLFLHAAAAMGFAPHDCVVVEDSPAGVAAARAAGMRVLGFAARTPASQLADADAVFASMSELPALLNGRA